MAELVAGGKGEPGRRLTGVCHSPVTTTDLWSKGGRGPCQPVIKPWNVDHWSPTPPPICRCEDGARRRGRRSAAAFKLAYGAKFAKAVAKMLNEAAAQRTRGSTRGRCTIPAIAVESGL